MICGCDVSENGMYFVENQGYLYLGGSNISYHDYVIVPR